MGAMSRTFAWAGALLFMAACSSPTPGGGGALSIAFAGSDGFATSDGLGDGVNGPLDVHGAGVSDGKLAASDGPSGGNGEGGATSDGGEPQSDGLVADGGAAGMTDAKAKDGVMVDAGPQDVVIGKDVGVTDASKKDTVIKDAGKKDVPPKDTGPKPECLIDNDCPKGLCVAEKCCPTKEQACGNICCKTAHVCFAQACVKPGKLCTSAADCGKGKYCELELGKGLKPPGGGGQPGQVCLKKTPKVGRCLNLPPKCKPGAPPPADGSCLPACIWKPPAGKLDPVVEWQWGPVAKTAPNDTDVWSTPTVGRIYDSNCDGKINELDPPVVVFVSSNSKQTCCSCGGAKLACRNGWLRMLDGASGKEIWSLHKAFPGSKGFAGMSTAIGDVTGDGKIDIVAMTGEGRVAVIDRNAKVLSVSTQAVPGQGTGAFGWGGGLALADMEGDGKVEIGFGATVFTFDGGKLVHKFTGKGGTAGAANKSLSLFSDLDLKKDGHLELVTGNTAYRANGAVFWKASVPDGFPAIGDFDKDGKPEVAVVSGGQLWLGEGNTGQVELGPLKLPGSGSGGPPTVADFDGDGIAEVGVAMRQFYVAAKPDYAAKKLKLMWKTANHDLSSSVTGSTVFDFEGDGAAEVIYNDECFLWVYDGKTGKVRFAALTTSFTATEASLVADVDGDGQAEMILMSNGANPSGSGWKCNVSPWNKPDPANNRPAWKPPKGQKAYRGIRVFGSASSGWVGTRTLWSQHTYHVTNICDDRDSACVKPNIYGSVPKAETPNWTLKWLNNFRQNVQDKGIFDAPDATVSLIVGCGDTIELHAMVRNLGLALLPAGVQVSFWFEHKGVVKKLAQKKTPTALYPGQSVQVSYVTTKKDGVAETDAFQARIEVDKKKPLFHDCNEKNNVSQWTAAPCFKNPLRY